MGGNETEIDFVLAGKNNKKYLKDMKAIPWELQHQLVVTDIDKRKLKKVVKNKQTFRRRVWKLKGNNIQTKFQKSVKELVDVDAPNLWDTFKNSTLQACDEVCGKKKGRRNHGNTWWSNEEVKEAIQQKKVEYKKMCENQLEENKAKYKNTVFARFVARALIFFNQTHYQAFIQAWALVIFKVKLCTKIIVEDKYFTTLILFPCQFIHVKCKLFTSKE